MNMKAEGILIFFHFFVKTQHGSISS